MQNAINMKLNIDCVRDVLLVAETCPFNSSLHFKELSEQLSDYYDDDIAYTCLKLKEANLLSVVTKTIGSRTTVIKINDISFSGHEFLNNIREPSVWDNVKAIGDKIGANSISAFMQIAANVINVLIQSHFGL